MAQRRAAGGARKAPRSVKHRLPERLPTGLELQDVGRRRWRLGRSIGTGGFGEIYLACELPKSSGSSASNEPATVPDDAPYVVKVEPHSNGPLFTEMHCYHRLASGTLVADWMKQRRLTRLGMPAFLGSGSVEVNTQRYRFMVLERYGTDLQRLIDNSADSRFPAVTVMRLAVQVLDVLEYIHSKEYVHADVKAQNLLVGFKKGFQNQVYLLDFGLACRYTSSDGEHNSYRADKRKAHNGTLEFTSRDAHVGAHSRRGDLEVLGYNLLLWAGGRLPWLPLPGSTPAAAAGAAAAGAGQCELVAAAKNRHMSAPRQLVARCCGDQQQQQQSGPAAGSLHPAAIAALEQYLEYVGQLQFEETPQYDVLRAIFTDALRVMGHANYAKLAQKPLQFDNHSDCVDAGAKKAKTGGKIAKTGRATTTAAAKKRQKTARTRRVSSCSSAGVTASHSGSGSSSGQENRRAPRVRRNRSPSGSADVPARSLRQPLRSVADNDHNTPPPPLSMLPPAADPPQLRSDGHLADFDWHKLDDALIRRKITPGRSSMSTTLSSRTSAVNGHDAVITPSRRGSRVLGRSSDDAVSRRTSSAVSSSAAAASSPQFGSPLTAAMRDVLARCSSALAAASCGSAGGGARAARSGTSHRTKKRSRSTSRSRTASTCGSAVVAAANGHQQHVKGSDGAATEDSKHGSPPTAAMLEVMSLLQRKRPAVTAADVTSGDSVTPRTRRRSMRRRSALTACDTADEDEDSFYTPPTCAAGYASRL